MENYEAAKVNFAVCAGLINNQRLFSDEQLAVIKNACALALEDSSGRLSRAVVRMAFPAGFSARLVHKH